MPSMPSIRQRDPSSSPEYEEKRLREESGLVSDSQFCLFDAFSELYPEVTDDIRVGGDENEVMAEFAGNQNFKD